MHSTSKKTTAETAKPQRPTPVLIAVGSNHDAPRALGDALASLPLLLEHMARTEVLVNPAIGIEAADFSNLLITGTTTLDASSLNAQLKAIERRCGDRRELRSRGEILLDLDLLAYGRQQLHQADWERGYIRQLLEELSVLCADRREVRRWYRIIHPENPQNHEATV